ncbi:SCO2400 family protein [Streptomyces lavendulocolor]|uniref:SCO2400 family protein n=1 Tax=Streptomyces lavendulocolor TaxID=67316 RepID=UPI0031DB864A
MDYCHQCQRHLNGALACAGCGTPVEELRHDDPQTSAAEHVYELDRDEELPPAAPRRARGRTRRAQPARRSRPAGRRARRKRGRTLLVVTGALILAAGLLSLAELAMEHPGEDGAATVVRQEDRAAPEPLPDRPDVSALPDAPEPVREPVVSASAPAPDDPEDGSGSGEEGTGAPSGVPVASAPASGDGPATGPSAPEPSGDPGEPGAPDAPGADEPAPQDPPPEDPEAPGTPGEPGGTAPGDPPPDDPPPAEPAPSPTATESCDWFLWWCV